MEISSQSDHKNQMGLCDETQILKPPIRQECFGNLEELNAYIGVVKSYINDKEVIYQLKKIQYNLFALGSESVIPMYESNLAKEKNRLAVVISEKETEELVKWIDIFNEKIKPLEYFILPGGGTTVATLHLTRAICRRAERSLVLLSEKEEVCPETLKYINRLSDYIFVLARYISKINKEKEEFWNPKDKL